MASYQADPQGLSARERVRQSERAHGYNTAHGTQTWATMGATGPRSNPTRRTRLPTPLAAPVPQLHTVATAQAAAAAAQAAAALAAEEPPAPTQTPAQSDAEEEPADGYETELYEHEEPYDQHVTTPPHGAPALSDHQHYLELEQEVAQLRLSNHHLQAEITRLRRLRNQERNLDQLATGPYWISRARR